MNQHQCGPLAPGQTPERARHDMPACDLVFECCRAAVAVGRAAGEICETEPTAPTVGTQIGDHAVEPGAKIGAVGLPCRCLGQQAKERVLDGILGLAAVVQQIPGIAHQRGQVPLDQSGPRRLFSLRSQLEQTIIRSG